MVYLGKEICYCLHYLTVVIHNSHGSVFFSSSSFVDLPQPHNETGRKWVIQISCLRHDNILIIVNMYVWYILLMQVCICMPLCEVKFSSIGIKIACYLMMGIAVVIYRKHMPVMFGIQDWKCVNFQASISHFMLLMPTAGVMQRLKESILYSKLKP